MIFWWRPVGALDRFILDLLTDEIARLRPGNRLSLTATSRLDAEEIGLDSLELLELASAMAETVQLGRSGIEDYLLARRSVRDWVEIARAGLDRFAEELVFRTSGSTGPAKACRHALATLEQEIAFVAGLVERPGRILSAVPSHHIYGFLFTLLLPGRLSVPLVDIRASGPWAVGRTSRPTDLVIGYPAYWDAVARSSGPLRAITCVSSAGSLRLETAQGLVRLGAARVLEIYGSTETAGLAWRESPDAPFELFPYWSNSADGLSGPQGTVQPPDRLEWVDERRFRIAGRHDGAVKVGGVTVNPERVRTRLLEHPDVLNAAVRPERIGDGWRLKAFIVPHPDCDRRRLAASLQRFIEHALTPPERPRALRYGAGLPVDAQGKPADWQ